MQNEERERVGVERSRINRCLEKLCHSLGVHCQARIKWFSNGTVTIMWTADCDRPNGLLGL
ncbi:hypothetical protein FRX31_010675 [Thalictrum thalictroides]|uniref:Uncharacterized protein n=1 Tax=Thalictrum thalictroides TaxID=46969 RepID=A0A7J6WSC1_THATH|nr:hypothetical protein FRX31_010675 [Thalictrum thalictroides]